MSFVNLTLFLALCISNLGSNQSTDGYLTIEMFREGDYPAGSMLLKFEDRGNKITFCVFDQKGAEVPGIIFEKTGNDNARYKVTYPGGNGSPEYIDLSAEIKSTSTKPFRSDVPAREILLKDGTTFNVLSIGAVQYVRSSMFEGALFVIHR